VTKPDLCVQCSCPLPVNPTNNLCIICSEKLSVGPEMSQQVINDLFKVIQDEDSDLGGYEQSLENQCRYCGHIWQSSDQRRMAFELKEATHLIEVGNYEQANKHLEVAKYRSMYSFSSGHCPICHNEN
jgi:hypothetical protein